jgi:cytochrome c oxidase subunit 3
MTTIETHAPPRAHALRWETYKHEHHWRTAADEFDAAKLGMWLFLTTEVLLFGGIFCSYAIFRMMYPEAFVNGSSYLNWRIGLLNTVVLLVSSFTVAMSVRCAQLNKQFWLKANLIITLICAAAFVAIKITFEYVPKLSVGKAPGAWFSYPFSHHAEEPIWWGIYYASTGIHALHVLIGGGLLTWVLVRSFRGIYGPKNYTMVETSGLYWHLVDLVWIFLFPLLYLIH